MRWFALGILIGLTACARAPVVRQAPPAPSPPTAPAETSSAEETARCREICRSALVACQDAPVLCDQTYNQCLSKC